MNNEIETIFKNFVVDDQKIPVSFLRYDGVETTYVTYQSIGNSPALNEEDTNIYSINSFDFDIYSTGNYLNIVQELKNKLKSNEFTWVEDSEDMYEEDTKMYHITITFEKERMC